MLPSALTLNTVPQNEPDRVIERAAVRHESLGVVQNVEIRELGHAPAAKRVRAESCTGDHLRRAAVYVRRAQGIPAEPA